MRSSIEALKAVTSAASSAAFSAVIQMSLDEGAGIERGKEWYLNYREQEFKRICLANGVDVDSMNKTTTGSSQ